MNVRTLNGITFSDGHRGKYQYQVERDCDIYTGTLFQGYSFNHDYFSLKDGWLFIKKGYRWNGADFFPDLDSIMRASLAHDCICQAIRHKLLPFEPCRLQGDLLLHFLCRQDGMLKPMAEVVYGAVRAYVAVTYA